MEIIHVTRFPQHVNQGVNDRSKSQAYSEYQVQPISANEFNKLPPLCNESRFRVNVFDL